MSTEAAAAYRYEQESLNKAKADGIILSDAQKQKITELSGAMAAQEEKTRRLKDLFEFGKSTVSGFFSDIKQGLQDGKSLIQSFGDAFVNVLNKIADKLMQMAIDDLFASAFGGAKGGGASGLGGLLGGLFGGGASGTSSGIFDSLFTSTMGSPFMFAQGAAFRAGNVVPFAAGGIVDRPALFPMARGMGLMGEAGPEAVMPLRRGRNGSLGVQMHGGAGAQQQPVVVYVTGDTDLVRVTSNQEAVKVVTAAAPQIESNAVNKSAKIAPTAVERDKQMRTKDWRLGSV
jgi:hypothetical protein